MASDLKEFEAQRDQVIAQIEDDPDNADTLRVLKVDLDALIEELRNNIAESDADQPTEPAPPKVAPPPPAEQPKWSHENHPAFKKPSAPVEEKEKEPEQVITYQVNDTVMAKWISGDKAFYPARITSVTGSSVNPIYTVKFKAYDTVETLRSKDIKPAAAQKRKADGSTVDSGSGNATNGSSSISTSAGTNNGIVLTAAADLYPQAQMAKAGAEGNADDKPRKHKKIKANKELEAGKSKWQEFSSKAKLPKAVKKESMFRTPDGFKGRVGFTGSGQAMRKDPTRSRHVYQPNEELD
ncbi:hypothetical protein B0H63DRAFT_524313 [Podospora didyma]|uniref:Tudor domain-containing protein n=1 Tax=Podospora didyma TaxID=330526 RepID=A0AAE0NHJ7_9PEZI|nr:hypothetical protein B0H63DRAFT_524313 [Podospora didyma]